jgi:hypothetical protein
VAKNFTERQRKLLGDLKEELREDFRPPETGGEIQKNPPPLPKVYADIDVCRLLGIGQRVTAQARTAKTRGELWDCVGGHAGMTEAWIKSRDPNADLTRIQPIKPGDGIITCRLVDRCPNTKKMRAAMLANGKTVIVTVYDSRLLRRDQQFDFRVSGRLLVLVETINPSRY